jgi:hypothetical protein
MSIKDWMEAVEIITDGWDKDSIPIAKNIKYGMWNLLGELGDKILSSVKGSICEIGIGHSSIYLTHLARKYNRKCWHCDYSVGSIQNAEYTPGYFAEDAIVFTGKSDAFFEEVVDKLTPKFALSFIDGDHMYEQVRKDFWNCWNYTVTDGCIFLHDTHPPDDSWKIPTKCGTVYKLIEELERDHLDEMHITTFEKECLTGLTVARKK